MDVELVSHLAFHRGPLLDVSKGIGKWLQKTNTNLPYGEEDSPNDMLANLHLAAKD